jgi:hypothetical protein
MSASASPGYSLAVRRLLLTGSDGLLCQAILVAATSLGVLAGIGGVVLTIALWISTVFSLRGIFLAVHSQICTKVTTVAVRAKTLADCSAGDKAQNRQPLTASTAVESVARGLR